MDDRNGLDDAPPAVVQACTTLLAALDRADEAMNSLQQALTRLGLLDSSRPRAA